MAVVPLGITNDVLPETREIIKITNRSDGVFTSTLMHVQQRLLGFRYFIIGFVLCFRSEKATKSLPKHDPYVPGCVRFIT